VFDSLVVGGLWILGRTVEETRPVRNEVSIFRKSEHGFRLLDRLNGGSELEESLKSWGFLNGEMRPLYKLGTTTTVGSSLNPSTFGTSGHFRATVSSPSGPPPDNESVTFKDGAATLGTGTLSAGSARVATSALAAGSHS
jgi:hypothetical protein